MKKKILYLMLFMFIGGPVLQSCTSTRSCKSKPRPAKCWNAKKQKYTRC